MIDLLVLFTEVSEEYVVQVRSPEVGETPQPPPRVRCEDLARIGVELAEARKNDNEEAVIARGRELFSKLFQPPNHNLYRSARAISKKTSSPIRLLLAMAPHSPLQRIPWELLHDGSGFLTRDLRCSIVRYLESENPVRAVALKPPIRILVTSASPQEVPRLGLESEIKGIHEAYSKHRSKTVFRYCEKTSLKALREILQGATLAAEPFHVWHHCGHGGIVKEEFRLCLEQRDHIEYAWVSDILRIIEKSADLRVVILNVCSAAGTALGLGPELAKLNVPSVLSFSSKIGDDRARRFALALHRGLLTKPIEVAVDIARASICDPGPDNSWHWSNLLLFSRRSDEGPLLLPTRIPPIDPKKVIRMNRLERARKAFEQ